MPLIVVLSSSKKKKKSCNIENIINNFIYICIEDVFYCKMNSEQIVM